MLGFELDYAVIRKWTCLQPEKKAPKKIKRTYIICCCLFFRALKGTLTDLTFSEEHWAAEHLFVPPLRSPRSPPSPPWRRASGELQETADCTCTVTCFYIKLCLFLRYTFPVPPWERLNVEPVVWFGRTLSVRACARARARALPVCNAEDGRQTGNATKRIVRTER